MREKKIADRLREDEKWTLFDEQCSMMMRAEKKREKMMLSQCMILFRSECHALNLGQRDMISFEGKINSKKRNNRIKWKKFVKVSSGMQETQRKSNAD